MSLREIDLDGCLVQIKEGSLNDEAGVVVWDASLVLVQYLNLLVKQSQGAFLRGRRVVDIGCGTGVSGLCAAALGAASVTLTDLPQLLPLIQQNIQLNSLQERAHAAALRWGEGVAHLQPPFDLVLASDVIYQAEAVPALLATLRDLSGPRTLILLAAEHREQLPFPTQQVEAAGFEVVPVAPEQLHPDWSSQDIAVYRLRLERQR